MEIGHQVAVQLHVERVRHHELRHVDGDPLAAADRRQNFSETEQRVLGEWVSITKGQRVQRQQAAARAKEAEKGYEATSFEAKEAEWQKADLAMNKGGAEGPGGLDNWMAKQANN